MDKIEYIETKILKTEHKFYCDYCNKFLGESTEYDDGYYEQYGEYEQTIYINSVDKDKKGRYYIKRYLCHECADGLTTSLINTLTALGFKKEDYF